MATILGPNYNIANADAEESLFNLVVAYNYDYVDNYDGITNLDFRKATTEQQVSMMFVLGQALSVKQIDVWMRRVGNPTDFITGNLYIEGASVGIPNTGASLGASAAVPSSDLSSSYEKVSFIFSSPVALNAGQNYYLVLTSGTVISTLHYFQIASDVTPVGYIRSGKYNGSVWAAQTSNSCIIVYQNLTTELSQGFKVAGDQELDSILIWMRRAGALAGNLVLEIYDDLNGVPDTVGPTNNISTPVAESSLTTSVNGAAVTFAFSPRPLLEDGRRYHFVLRTTSTHTDSIFAAVRTDISNPTFSGGTVQVNNQDGSWRELDEVDSIFEIYYLEQAAPDTLGTALALLGDPPVDCRAQQVWLKSLVSTLSSFYPSTIPPQYGGTGIGIYEAGDMLYATSPFHLERLPIGEVGQGLGIDAGGLPAWGLSGADVIFSLKNVSSSVYLYPGDVVKLNLTAGPPFYIETTTLIGDQSFVGVVQDTIAPLSVGPVLARGFTEVRVNSTVAAGDYLDTSSVAGRASLSLYGPMKAMRSGVAGELVWVYVNPQPHLVPYTRFSDVQAFNVAGTSVTFGSFGTIGLNTYEYNSHPGLFTLAANEVTFHQAGNYRLRFSFPVSVTGGSAASILGKIRQISPTPSDSLISDSPTNLVTPIISGIGDTLRSANDVIAVQAQGTAGTGTAIRCGSPHGLSAFSNRYTVLEIWKIKDIF